jgi:hypothetical protein
MPITKNKERQDLLVAWVDINLADVTSNVAAAAMALPVGAVVVSGQLITTEAWNSTTSDVMDVGDASSATRYLTDGNIRALGARVALVPTGFTSVGDDLTVTWTSGGGSPTTGKARLEVVYFIKGRAKSSIG